MDTQTVALKTIQQTIARALASGKYDRKRIERAAQLIAMGAVTKVSEHEYRVESQSNDGTFYKVTPDGCHCMDSLRRPSDRCKHDIAVRVILSAEIQERNERFTTMQLARLKVVKDRYQRGQVTV